MNFQSSNSVLAETPFPDVCIHQRFEYQARKHPEAVAVAFEGKRLTYGELNQKANQLALYLGNLGVEPGTLVGLFVQKSLEVTTGILGILKNGCAYVPLDPAYPEERLHQMIEDAEFQVILTQSNLKKMLPETRAGVICLDTDWKRISKEKTDNPKSDATSDSLAYVIFTSGSTGKPKGVCCHHRGVMNLLADFQNRQPLGPGDIGSWWTSLNFDVSIYEIFSPLMEGATLIIVPESIRPDAPALMDWLNKEKITNAYLPPFMVTDLDVWLQKHPANSALHRLLVGVEAIPENLLNSITNAVPGLHIINGYGPTEATVCATLYSIGPENDLHENTPIGKPVQNTQIYLLDEEGRQVPAGEPGEICIGGVGVANGYLNRPDLTAECFIPDPFLNKAGARLYKTGDSARLMPDGNIEFIGRADFQVKFHGYRVELGEIETKLRKHPAIREAVVLLREDIPGVKRLVAYLVCYEEEEEVSANEFRTLLKKSLPDYMVPSVFVLLDKIPMTPNGKTDRSALPLPSQSDVVQLRQTDYKAPETAEEITIAGLFTELLQVDRVGINDSFFELGGQSLLATQLCSRIEKSLDIRIPVQAVFEGPTVSELAQTIETARQKEGISKFPEILTASGKRSQFPASFAQQGMWFMQQFSESSILYNIPLIVWINGPLQVKLLHKTVNEIIERHESLRTTLAIDGEKVVQHISEELAVDLPVADLRHLQAEKGEDEFERLAEGEGRYPFDLGKGPLLRFLLVQLGEEDYRLIFTIHHAIIDGWGAGIFFSELQALYEAFEQDRPSPLSSVSIQYGDFAVWQQEWLKSDTIRGQLAYWREKLAGPPASLKLPLDRARPRVQTNSGSRHYLTLSKALTASLNEMGRNENVSLFMLLLGIYQTLFHKYSGQEDITTGSAIANRNHPQGEKIVGVFINAIAMRTDFSGDPSFHELLKRVRQTTLEAYANQDIPFELLVETMVQERDTSRHPVFQASLILQNMPWPSMEFCDLKISYDEVGNHTSKLDLLVVFEERKGALEGWFEYNPDLFDHATIETMAANYQHFAEQIVGSPDKRLSQLNLQHDSDHIGRGFSCYIIGETSLPVRCAEILLRQGCQILGLISPDPANRDWAVENGVPYFHAKQDLVAIMRQQPFDYLFSIVNSDVLPSEVLTLPKKYAINYHDAFLPKYAGVYSTSWAIINREKTHGITWHLMAEEVDTGDILKQYPVDIEPEDTALTLNVRCFETALQAFSELIEDLTLNKANLSKQDLKKRTYFPLYKRPPSAGVLSWDQDAEDMSALVRAMTFGASYPNEMVSPKIAVGREFFIVSKLGILDSTSRRPVGAIVEIKDKSLTLSTKTRDISIQGLMTIDGKPLSIPDFVKQFDLHSGDNIENLGQEFTRRLRETNDKICRDESFWLRRLRIEQPVELPYFNWTGKSKELDHPSTLSLSIPEELIRLSETKDQEGAFENLVISAFAAFLARLSNLETFTLGYRPTTLTKDQGGLENLFTFSVPLIVTINPGLPFNQIVDIVQKQIDLVIKHKTYTRDIFVRHPELSPVPRPVHVLICSPADAVLPEGASFALVISQRASALEWYYDPGVLPEKNIHRMKDQFNLFLFACLSDPGRPIAELPLLTPEEYHRILVEWNDTTIDFNINKCYHEYFSECVARFPDAVAVEHMDHQLTYRELDLTSNRLSNYLSKRGAGPDVPVAFCLERSLEMMIGLLAILKSGSAYLPLDKNYPEDRLRYMLQDSRAKLLLTTSELSPTLPDETAEHILIDMEKEVIEKENDIPPETGVSPDNTAYVIYTSGSTGAPKGVRITHRNLLNHNFAVIKAFGIDSGEHRFLQFASISFDISVEEIFPTWLLGQPLILRTEEAIASIPAFFDFIRRENITVLNLPTAYFHEMAYALQDQELPPSVKIVVIGGEKVSEERFRLWQSHATDNVLLFNTYGPTETTVSATFTALNDLHPDGEGLSIGRPLANVRIYILDPLSNPVPIGVAGELYIGGAGVSPGYLNRPELTSERFVADPFSEVPEARMYRTGDLSIYRSDGDIEFIGRADNQVKLRGFRIELDEIQTRLVRQGSIRDAVVIMREDTPDANYIAAYLTRGKNRTPDIDQIKKRLAKELPDYMVPAVFVELNELPMTPGGKIDKKVLPTPVRGELFRDAKFTPPRTEMEKILAEIWRDALKIDKISAKSDFFRLGGHSLAAMRVTAGIETALDIKCPIKACFEYSTLAGLAGYLEGCLTDEKSGFQIEKALDRSKPFSLSFSQHRMWFLNQFENIRQGVYNVPLTFHLDGPLNIAALEKSVRFAIKRHESLRTIFKAIDGKPKQVILKAADFRLSLEKLDRKRLEEELAVQASLPFDLTSSPAWRLRLFELGHQKYALSLVLHHIICDGLSVKTFIEELNKGYAAFVEGQHPELAELPFHYADYACWEGSTIQGKELESMLSFWRNCLIGYGNIDLPTDYPRPAVLTYNGRIQRSTFDKNTTERLQALTRQTNSTLFMVLLSCLNIFLKQHTGQEGFAIGIPVANRENHELDHLLGMFTNTLATRTDLSGAPTFLELCERVRLHCLEVLARQNMPFEYLIDSLSITRDASRSPVFQVMMILHNAENNPIIRFPGVKSEQIEVHNHTAKFDLTFTFEERDHEINLEIEYNTDLFTAETIKLFGARFETLLVNAALAPETPVDALSLLPSLERNRLLYEWNSTYVDFPRGKCLHQLIEEQVVKTPDNTAIIFENIEITYSELNHKAAQIAGRLRHMGVSPGDMVGVSVDRSIDMMTALLGILKSGAAYVPMDPAFPKGRLDYMVQNAEPKIIITQEDLAADLPIEGRGVLLMDKEKKGIYQEPVPDFSTDYDPESLAYVIFTSGSTGNPKGVKLPHRAVVNFLLSMKESPGIFSDDTVLAVTTLSFDIHVLELFLPLVSGAAVLLAGRKEAMDSFILKEKLRLNPVTIIQATPATFKILIEAGWQGAENLKILCGGEPMTPDLAEKLLDCGNELWNMYGPTETTVWSTILRITTPNPPVLIGRPIANTLLYILDENRKPVPTGVIGELCIGGKGVAQGYLNRPELTEKYFVLNPFNEDGADLIYNTGDLARYHANGMVECLGRSDFQVKVNGFRIELEEIEAALCRHKSIRDAVTTVHELKTGTQHIVAYLILVDGKDLDPEGIRCFLLEILPHYMIPTFFVTLESFPLTPNKKVDRKALPDPDTVQETHTGKYEAPYTPEQEALCNVYASVLGLRKVGIHDNFFELGGDSLLTIQVIDQLHRAGLRLTVEQFFQHHSIEELSKVVLPAHSPTGEIGEIPCMVELQRGDSDQLPFFLAHTPPGDLLGYVNLIQALDRDQPVYGFQSTGLFDNNRCHETIREMAAYYVRLMLKQQPTGPYMLGGWCLGGTVAFEMACQLKKEGHEIALLAVFDTHGLTPAKRQVSYYWYLFQEFFLLGPKCWRPYLSSKIKRKMREKLDQDFRDDIQLKDIGIFANRSIVRRKNMDAVIRYRSEYYPDEITVFIAGNHSHSIMGNPTLGWEPLVKKVQVIPTPGEHATQLKPPNVQVLAERLTERIKDKLLSRKKEVRVD